jgi:hypothetical protein
MKGKEQRKEQKKEKAPDGKAKTLTEYQQSKLSRQNNNLNVK